jgi:N utilization substance protein B
MGGRKGARETVLKILYRFDFLKEGKVEEVIEEEIKGKNVDRKYVEEMVTGILSHKSEIDGEINRISKRWKVEKMNPVDRNILRIGCYELIFKADIPPKVSINEAVELAKKYGTEKSSAFVNGILDRLAKELQKT